MSAIHVELLTKAKEIIAKPDFRDGLCEALDQAAGGWTTHPCRTPAQHAAQRIKEHVHVTLCPDSNPLAVYCLESWLERHHGVSPKPMRRGMPKKAMGSWVAIMGYPPSKKLIATRLAWIDWLIEEWRDAP